MNAMVGGDGSPHSVAECISNTFKCCCWPDISVTNYNYNYFGMTAKLNAENVLHKICIPGLDDKINHT